MESTLSGGLDRKFHFGSLTNPIAGVYPTRRPFAGPDSVVDLRDYPMPFFGYGGTGAARAIGQLAQILATVSLKQAIHIGMIEMMGMLNEGKSMADYRYFDDSAKRMLDEIVSWAGTLKERRFGTGVAEAA
jgi:hypothetical protein